MKIGASALWICVNSYAFNSASGGRVGMLPGQYLGLSQHGGAQHGRGAGAFQCGSLVVARDQFVVGRAWQGGGRRRGHAMSSSARRSAVRA